MSKKVENQTEENKIIEAERKKALTFWLYGITDMDPSIKEIKTSKALKRALIKYFVADVQDIQHKVKYDKLTEDQQLIAKAKEEEAKAEDRKLQELVDNEVQSRNADEPNKSQKPTLE